MRSSLVLLAGLASSALAYPTDVAAERRTFGLLTQLLGDAGSDVVSLLETVLGGGHSSSVSLLAGISAHAAAALEGGALGCSAGTIHASAREELKAWLHTTTVITGSLKNSLLSWCEGEVETLSVDVIAALAVYIPTCAEVAAKESIYVTIDGIFSASEIATSELVLSLSAQSSLSAFLSAATGLAAEVEAGLSVCAAGGVVASLSAEIKAALLAWVQSSECSLDAGLKVTVLAWLHGHHGGDLVALGSISDSALTTISVGASIGAFVEEGGALSVHAQAILAAFLDTKVAVDIDANVLLGLKACAHGELASSLDVEIRTALAIWLSSSDCTLGVELKAVVLLWLSLAVTAEVSVDIVSGLLVDISGFLTETVLSLLSVNLRGALSLLAAGESLTVLSWETRAELAALLGGCTGIDIGISIELIIFEWFTGCSIPGAPSGGSGSYTSVPGLPSSTATVVPSIPVPTGPVPTGSVPYPSGSYPTGPAPSESVPAGSVPSGPAASSTPCETETIPVVTPIPTGSYPVPSESVPSGPVPTGSVPSGPAPSESVPASPGASSSPCETDTIPVVTPIPTGSSPTGPAPSESVPSESTPCETSPAGTPYPGGGSGSGSGSGYGEGSSTIAIPPAVTSAPAGPTGGAGGGGSWSYTETVWVTKTVCNCE